MLIFLKRYNGFTLLELMTTVALIALVLAIGIPSMRSFIERTAVNGNISEIRLALASARSYAVNKQVHTTICGRQPSGECSRDWTQNLTIFEDPNRNRRIDPNETIIHTLTAYDDDRLRIEYNRRAVTFFPSGRSTHSAGSLTLCLPSDPPISAAFVVAATGRIRDGKDSNGNGIQETGNGNDIDCQAEQH
jgi:type IV fimbrial biogenesis protein FimT